MTPIVATLPEAGGYFSVVKLAVIYALGAPTSIYRRFDVFNASLSVIHVREGRARLITLNDISHLG